MKRSVVGKKLLVALLAGVMTVSAAKMPVSAEEHVYARPENPRWDASKPGGAHVNINDPTRGFVYATMYKDDRIITSYSGWNEGAKTISYGFFRHIDESGTYTFKVKISGSDNEDSRDMSTGSVSDTSVPYVYNKPSVAVGTPQNLRWSSENDKYAMWDTVENADGYWVYLYVDGVRRSSITVPGNRTYADLSYNMTDPENKKYTFAVRALSPNIETYANSEMSGQSAVYSGASGGGTGYKDLVWETINGKSYWYENNERQGTYSDTKCFSYEGTLRGREIYDPASDGWYWLDVNADGAKAVGKEVFMPYIYQTQGTWSEDEINTNAAASGADAYGNIEHAELADQVKEAINNHTGKWVRYDNNGMMLKGWVKIEGDLAVLYPHQAGNIYYYDRKTGLMAKGKTVIGGTTFYFDETTGVLQP